MPVETRPFDPARYLNSDEACAAYMTEALETGDPACIYDALGVVARARRMNEAVETRQYGDQHQCPQLDHGQDSALSTFLQAFRSLGLRLTVRPMAQ